MLLHTNRLQSVTAARSMRAAAIIALATAAMASWWPAESMATPAMPAGPGLDESFGKRGVMVFRIGGRNTAVELCERGPNGQLLIGGISSRGKLGDGIDPGSGRFWLSRLSASGKPLRRFGKNGTLERFPMKGARIWSLTSDELGRTLVVVLIKVGRRSYAQLTRLTTSGRIDRGFGSRGVVALGRFTWKSSVTVISARDRIFVAIDRRHDHLSIRSFKLDGAIDKSFGDGSVTPTGLVIQKVISSPDGGLFVAGSSETNGDASAAIVRKLRSDGTTDTTWAAGGEHRVESTPPSVAADLNISSPLTAPETLLAVDVIPMADGGVTVDLRTYGKTYGLSPNWVQRLDPNGRLDATFGTGGSLGISFGFLSFDGGGGDYSRTFTTFAPDGRTFVGGYSELDGKPSFGLSSFTASGTRNKTADSAIKLGRANSWILDQEIDGPSERLYECGFASQSRPYRAVGYVFATRTR